MPENEDEKQTLTREEYRKQQQQADKEFQERDKKRVQVERDYAKTHQTRRSQSDQDEQPTASCQSANPQTEKWQQTRKKLNWTILALIILIVIVYLVLFFVN